MRERSRVTRAPRAKSASGVWRITGGALQGRMFSRQATVSHMRSRSVSMTEAVLKTYTRAVIGQHACDDRQRSILRPS